MMKKISLFQVGAALTCLLPVALIAGPAPLDVVATSVVVLFLVSSVVHKDFSWIRTLWFQLALLLMAYMTLRNAFGEDPLAMMSRSLTWIRFPLLTMALSYWILKDRLVGNILWSLFVAATVFLILDTLWQYLNHYDIFGREALELYNGALRLTGPFSAPRVGITIVWFLFPILLPLIFSKKPQYKIVGLSIFVAAVIAVFLSGERTAFLLLGLGMFFTGIAHIKCWRAMVILFFIIGGLTAALVLHDKPLSERYWLNTRTEITAFASSTYGRTWLSAIAITKEHPLFGVGSKQFAVECRKSKYGSVQPSMLEQRCPMHTHNVYLEWLVEYGLLGLFLCGAMIGGILSTYSSRELKSNLGQPIVLGLTLAFIIRLWPISVTPSQFVSWSAIPFWLIIGSWLSANRDANKASSSTFLKH